MTDDAGKVAVRHHLKLEKRNDAGELYETVELDADDQGTITKAKVTQRKEHLAPDDAYARDIPLDQE